VVDAQSTKLLSVSALLKPLGKIEATATSPEGQVLFSAHGNLLRHDFSMRDPSGAEVARVHESWLALRDSYALELVGDVEPMAPILFAVLLDRAGQAERGRR
jgi:uncharacterized protein YxjI